MRRCTVFRRVVQVGVFAVTIAASRPTELRLHDHIETRPGSEFVTNIPEVGFANGSNSSGRAYAGVARGTGAAFDASTLINRAA
jgi:hypothetical protein